MEHDDVWTAIDDQRRALVRLLEHLPEEEWRRPSLCDGWTVRQVAAHLALQNTPWSAMPRAVLDLIRRGGMNGAIHAMACRHAELPVEVIVGEIRDRIGVWRPLPAVTFRETAIDYLVHGQDIAVPLGQTLPMPPGLAVLAADRVWSRPPDVPSPEKAGRVSPRGRRRTMGGRAGPGDLRADRRAAPAPHRPPGRVAAAIGPRSRGPAQARHALTGGVIYATAVTGAPPPRRLLLGPAEVEDDELAAFVAAVLGVRHATVLTSSAKVFPYDRPAITTAGRYLVTGSARTGTGQVCAFALFVKVIHAYQRSPLRFAIPAYLRAQAAALIPWRTEADLYRSDLPDRLPHGLTIPRAAAVRDLDAHSAALWLEHVPARRVVWDLRQHARAAYLLGRLAASRAVAPLATAVHGARTPRVYAGTWLTHVVLPALTGNGVWAHPLVRDAFDARLRSRLLAAADALPALLDELDDAPAATSHGDACTANLLAVGDRDALVMVDLGFCGRAPLGTDLGQLILGEVQTGQRSAADLAALEAACLPAYVAGIHAEGGTASLARVRRTHATLLAVFSALPSVPLEHLDDEPAPRLRRLFRSRAAVARFALDLLDDTTPSTRPSRTR
jgi:uncharacterized protein (TIGR03083 family)